MSETQISEPKYEDHSKNPEEDQYLDMVPRIIDKGSREKGRNGMTRCLFGESLVFCLDDGRLPLLTSKRWRGVRAFGSYYGSLVEAQVMRICVRER